MIELPEALVISQQMNDYLMGKVIDNGNRGNSPHKFAFSSGTDEEYKQILQGKTLGHSWSHGMSTLTLIGNDHVLILGCGGERILYHKPGISLPKKYQLLLNFIDGSALTVTISGWGNTLLVPAETAGQHAHVREDKFTPLDENFTLNYFLNLFSDVDPNSTKSIKYFMISEPGIHGIGNGCLQDILFHAKLHPRRRVVDINHDEQTILYNVIVKNLTEIIQLGGRDSEVDLFGVRGKYHRLMDSKTNGQPCPVCETPIEKMSYLGGTCYFCPSCQK